MNRRLFFKSLIASTFASAFPSVAKDHSGLSTLPLPKVPISDANRFYLGSEEYTITIWVHPGDKWKNLAQVHKEGVIDSYVNGFRVDSRNFNTYGIRVIKNSFGGFDVMRVGNGKHNTVTVTDLSLWSIGDPDLFDTVYAEKQNQIDNTNWHHIEFDRKSVLV